MSGKIGWDTKVWQDFKEARKLVLGMRNEYREQGIVRDDSENYVAVVWGESEGGAGGFGENAIMVCISAGKTQEDSDFNTLEIQLLRDDGALTKYEDLPKAIYERLKKVYRCVPSRFECGWDLGLFWRLH